MELEYFEKFPEVADLIYLADARLRAGLTDEAIATAEAYCARNKNGHRQARATAELCVKAGDHAKAIHYYELAIKGSKKGRKRMACEFAICDALVASGKRADAIRRLEGLVEEAKGKKGRASIEKRLARMRAPDPPADKPRKGPKRAKPPKAAKPAKTDPQPPPTCDEEF